ncbi:Ser/Thr phosphatase family protein [Ancylostoma duodenale]|uniref:Ser/Thr phosphatase family protein n=1 Tax=Ancylostoma duodenale TaxID=51022 RepID=A0A0C2H3H3_9BILA|nr:Ser/Thr phosphatase family protein [Ancylostoma duodenale]
MRRVDPNSEEDYWETIKATKVQLPVEVNSKGEVNSPPSVPHLKVVCISDTHDQLDLVKDIPDGDVLIHAGDLTNYGSERELKKVNEELGRLPHKHKLIVAGNHDLGFDDSEDPKGRLEKYRGQGTPKGYLLLTNVTYLQDKGVEVACHQNFRMGKSFRKPILFQIEGVKFFGSSWHPLYGYPFYRPRSELKKKWKVLPSNLDVLITHTPALGERNFFVIVNPNRKCFAFMCHFHEGVI